MISTYVKDVKLFLRCFTSPEKSFEPGSSLKPGDVVWSRENDCSLDAVGILWSAKSE